MYAYIAFPTPFRKSVIRKTKYRKAVLRWPLSANTWKPHTFQLPVRQIKIMTLPLMSIIPIPGISSSSADITFRKTSSTLRTFPTFTRVCYVLLFAAQPTSTTPLIKSQFFTLLPSVLKPGMCISQTWKPRRICFVFITGNVSTLYTFTHPVADTTSVVLISKCISFWIFFWPDPSVLCQTHVSTYVQSH